MNSEDKKYLRYLGKQTPRFEVFEEMVQLLRNLQAKTDQVLKASVSATA